MPRIADMTSEYTRTYVNLADSYPKLDYGHYNFITSPEVPQIIGKFLAASQVAPAPEQT
jgi:hypothetical protein